MLLSFLSTFHNLVLNILGTNDLNESVLNLFKIYKFSANLRLCENFENRNIKNMRT